MTILLVRHAQSEGNADDSIFDTKPDHALHLSPKGEQQARDLGVFLKEFYAHNPPKKNIRLWSSPYRRCMLTVKGMKETIGEMVWDKCGRGREIQFDDRLRERSWGLYQPHSYRPGGKLEKDEPALFAHYRRTREADMGKFYARPLGGESASDVMARMHTLFPDIYFDIERGVTDHLIVTHAMAMTAFAFGFTKTHPRFLDYEVIPGNTAVRLLDLDPSTQRYADYGVIYDPEENVYLLDRPEKPVPRDMNLLWE